MTIIRLLCALAGFGSIPLAASERPKLPRAGLVLDLDAARGVDTADDGQVVAWENQASDTALSQWKPQDEGRAVAGSGRPTLRQAAVAGRPALVFHRQELVTADEETLDSLTTGGGLTFLAVLAPLEQVPNLKDVNAFFGNLRNGGYYEGFWAGFDDDNTIWIGARNGRSFGRWDANNPKLSGPRLKAGGYALVGGRLEAGAGERRLELFVNAAQPVAAASFPVNPDADPSRPAIGQERDAIEHPGKESFDGEIARFLLWNRPLGDAELRQGVAHLQQVYR